MTYRNTFRYGSAPPTAKPTAAPASSRTVSYARSTYDYSTPAYEPYTFGEGTSTVRDGWSAYRVSDAALDDFEDVTYISKKKDAAVLSEVNELLDGLDLSPVGADKRQRTGRRRGVNADRTAAIKEKALSKKSTQYSAPNATPRQNAQTKAYIDKRLGRTIQPTVVEAFQYELSTVNNGSELLKAKNKLISTEPIDLDAPSSVAALKVRIREAGELMDRQKLMLDRYITDPSADEIKRHVENQSDRYNQPPRNAPKMSSTRSHVREVLQRCGNRSSGDY